LAPAEPRRRSNGAANPAHQSELSESIRRYDSEDAYNRHYPRSCLC
jgi:hypothetical protein